MNATLKIIPNKITWDTLKALRQAAHIENTNAEDKNITAVKPQKDNSDVPIPAKGKKLASHLNGAKGAKPCGRKGTRLDLGAPATAPTKSTEVDVSIMAIQP